MGSNRSTFKLIYFDSWINRIGWQNHHSERGLSPSKLSKGILANYYLLVSMGKVHVWYWIILHISFISYLQCYKGIINDKIAWTVHCFFFILICHNVMFLFYFSSHLKIVNRRPIQSRPPSFTSHKLSNLYNSAPSEGSDTCSVYKVSMNQELFYQYVDYETSLPDLKEFTLCMWTKFHNHSDDHPLFSYAGKYKIIFVILNDTKYLIKKLLLAIYTISTCTYHTHIAHNHTHIH